MEYLLAFTLEINQMYIIYVPYVDPTGLLVYQTLAILTRWLFSWVIGCQVVAQPESKPQL